MMQRGFTLVELAIVLVIVGTLTGGIMIGQSLVRSAGVRGALAEAQLYGNAVIAFQEKYNALPGDMPDATDYWGVLHATPATCRTTVSSTSATCNGNGDGSIADQTGSNEPFRAWQHLSNAGLIEGVYEGTTGSVGAVDYDLGRNAPASKLSPAGFGLSDFNNSGGTVASWPGMKLGNALWLGTEEDNSYLDGVALTPSEASMMDTKIDDGMPRLGAVLGGYNSTCTDTSTATTTTAQYKTDSNAKACFMLFGFQQAVP